MNAVEKVFALLERAENAEFFCRHFKEDRDRALAERDAAMAEVKDLKTAKADKAKWFEIDPFDPFGLYERAPLPYCWYGVAPTLFDAPSRAERAEICARDWEQEANRRWQLIEAERVKVKELEALHRTYFNQPFAEACHTAAREERVRLCRLFTTMEFNLRKYLPSSTETVGLTTESALREAEKGQP